MQVSAVFTLIRNPYEICELSNKDKTKKDYATLKEWLSSISFFSKYPDLIMDRV